MQFCVGLTGGIGSGKSSAASRFEELGATVVDTDRISHELTGAGGAAIDALRERFGAEFIAADGSLDRARMRDRVFRDPAARKELESVLHPMIRERTRASIVAARGPYVVVVVPLLFERGAFLDVVRRVLVVDCEEDVQVRRATARSGISPADVRRIMAAQLPRAERLAHADDVIDNNGSLEALRQAVSQLHERYLGLARGA
jgi:dephospho-CoA kinase